MQDAIVHIVDDDHHVRAATSFLLHSRGYRTEVYADGLEFLAQATPTAGCVLLDLRMPGLNGIEVQEELTRRGISIPVIMLSGHGDIPVAVQAVKAGAIEFIEKPYAEDALVAAIARAISIGAEQSAQQSRKVQAKATLNKLSPREHDVLQGLLAGQSNKVIAHHLTLSPRTVEMHRAHIMDTVGVKNLPALVRMAIDADLAPTSDETGARAYG
jgi:two-component system response regulator FixJ